MICETISCSVFQSVQCKNVLHRVQLLVTVYMKRRQIMHQVRHTYGKTLLKMNYGKNICILIYVKNGKYDHNQQS